MLRIFWLVNPLYILILSYFGGISITPIFLFLLVVSLLFVLHLQSSESLFFSAILLFTYILYSLPSFEFSAFLFYTTTIIQVPLGVMYAKIFQRYICNPRKDKSLVYWIFFHIIGVLGYAFFLWKGHSYGAFSTYIEGIGPINRYMDWIFIPILLLILSKNNFQNNIPWIKVAYFLCFLLVILSFTRTVWVAAFASLITIWIFNKNKLGMLFNLIAVGVVFTLVAFALDLDVYIFNRVENLFAVNEYDTSSYGRLKQFQELSNTPVFGIGFLAKVGDSFVYYLFSWFLSIFYAMGIFGFLLVVILCSLHIVYFFKIRIMKGYRKMHFIYVFAAINYLIVVLNLFPYNNYLPILLLYVMLHTYLISEFFSIKGFLKESNSRCQ